MRNPPFDPNIRVRDQRPTQLEADAKKFKLNLLYSLLNGERDDRVSREMINDRVADNRQLYSETDFPDGGDLYRGRNLLTPLYRAAVSRWVDSARKYTSR